MINFTFSKYNNLHEVVIDLVDDLQMSRQNSAKHVGGPALHGLREDRVIGVRTTPSRDVPSLQPIRPIEFNISSKLLYMYFTFDIIFAFAVENLNKKVRI